MLSGLAAGTTNIEGSDGVPDFFVKEMLFPYVAGSAWIEARRAGGAGWSLIDAHYQTPPATTAEILHPERRATPRLLLAPADRPSESDIPAGMRVLYADTFGEWMLGTLLERAGAADAKALAAEWRDDRILFFEPKRIEGEEWPVGFVWRIRTASPDAARRLRAALLPLYERPDGRPVAAVTAFDDRVEIVRGRPQERVPSAPLQDLQRRRQEDEELDGVERPVGEHGRDDAPGPRERDRRTDVMVSKPTKKNGSL